MPWLEEWEIGFEDYYVDLTITNKTEGAKPLHLHELFNSAAQNSGELPTRILIEAPAGYGKTTLARKLCFDHSRKKSYIRHFDAVILLRLREFSGTLEQMIISTYDLENCSDELLLEILIQNQRKILFVLDGMDELQQDKLPDVIPLLKGKHYPQSTVIVTSRAGNIELESKKPNSPVTNLLHCVNSRILIRGVTGENRVKFLQLYLKDYSSEKCDTFIKLANQKFGLSDLEENLFECPLYLILLVIVAEETDLASLKSKTKLYKQLFNFILRRTLAKEGQVDQTVDFFEFSAENPPAYVEMLFRFGSFAGEVLEKRQYTFTEEEIFRGCGNDVNILKLGILTCNDSKIGLRRRSWFEPIHLSFLEFSYAYSVWVGRVSTHPFLRFYDSINMVNLKNLLSKNNLVKCFLFGLCWKQLPTLVSGFTYDQGKLVSVMKQMDHKEMMTESQLELNELGKVFLPIIPLEFSLKKISEELPILLKAGLIHAVQTRRDQRIILEQEYHTTEQHQGSWLKVTTLVDTLVIELKSEFSRLESKVPFFVSHFSDSISMLSDLDSKLSLLDSKFKQLNSALQKLNSALQKLNSSFENLNSELSQLNSKISHLVSKLSCLTSKLPKLVLEFLRLVFKHSFSEVGFCVSEIWRSVSEFWHSCSEALPSDSEQLLSDSEFLRLHSDFPNFYCELPNMLSEILYSMHCFLCSISGVLVSVSKELVLVTELQHSDCEFLISVWGCLVFLCEVLFFVSNFVYSVSVNFVNNYEILILNSQLCHSIDEIRLSRDTWLKTLPGNSETIAAISERLRTNPECLQLNSEISCIDSVVYSSASDFKLLSRRISSLVYKLWDSKNQNSISQEWRELTTSQNFMIRRRTFGQPEKCRISFTICEAPLQEQLRWLSDFLTIEGVFQNKPIHTIHYECSSENFPKLIVLMTDLIRQERVVGVKLEMLECPSAELWKEFICCANASRELLELFVNKVTLCNTAESPLVVDLSNAERKQWRKVELAGNVVLSVGSQLVQINKLHTYDLDSLVRCLPSNAQTLQLRHATFGIIRVFQNGSLPTAHNVEELFIRFSNNNSSLLQSCDSESLKNLKVLGIILDPVVEKSKHDVTTFLLSMIFHCHSLVRVEFGYLWPEQLIASFLEHLIKDKWPTLSDQGESVHSDFHLNTLLIPACDFTGNNCMLTSSTAKLVKEALQTGCIEHLWINCTHWDAGHAIRKFMEFFSSVERFNVRTVDEQSWSKHNRRGTVCILEVTVKSDPQVNEHSSRDQSSNKPRVGKF